MNRLLITIGLSALALTFVVVVFGAYVRLSDAGLGCPDWPGCYGHIVIPSGEAWISAANEAYPERPVELFKAWVEMIHRHLAKLLGLLIIAMAVVAWRESRRGRGTATLPIALVALVIFQGILGMWTVTLQLKPLVVTAHLLGGMSVLALLWAFVLSRSRWGEGIDPQRAAALRPWALAGMGAVVAQIALGGWTSTNYAALACTDFPTCHQQWWPAMDFSNAFVLWRGLGINYEYGVLDAEARVAIHVTHRLGAIVVALVLAGLAVALIRSGDKLLRRLAALVVATLTMQIGLGIANVLWVLPLPVAVAHNGGAALLLLALVAVHMALRAPLRHAVAQERCAAPAGRPVEV